MNSRLTHGEAIQLLRPIIDSILDAASHPDENRALEIFKEKFDGSPDDFYLLLVAVKEVYEMFGTFSKGLAVLLFAKPHLLRYVTFLDRNSSESIRKILESRQSA